MMDSETAKSFVKENTLTEWTVEKWLAIKDRTKDCVWIEGAFLEHPSEGYVYFAPEPSQIGLFYEIKISDIVDALPTGTKIDSLGTTYTIVRIYLKRDLVLVKKQWCLAADLPWEARELRRLVKRSSSSVSGLAQIDHSTSFSAKYHAAPVNGGGGGEGNGGEGDGGGSGDGPGRGHSGNGVRG